MSATVKRSRYNSYMSCNTDASKAIELAEQLCRERGVRLTPQRRDVLAIISGSDQPLGAYDIMEQLRSQQPRIAPPTVYRALEFLLTEGLIHKLESLHAFVGCQHPDHPHFSQFLICKDCGEVAELHNSNINSSVDDAAREKGFVPDRSTVEVVGVCGRCHHDSEAI